MNKWNKGKEVEANGKLLTSISEKSMLLSMVHRKNLGFYKNWTKQGMECKGLLLALKIW